MQKSALRGVEYIIVDEGYAGQRIDNFLLTRLKGVPKTRIYRIVRKGEVRVNKKRIQPGYRLQPGDSIRVPPIRMDEKEAPVAPSRSLQELLSGRILFEDKLFLIINKPAGVAVHGGSGFAIGVVEALKSMYPKLPQLELAHRLDLDTSGCLILAKKRSALRELHELFRSGKTNKMYWVLTRGHWKASDLRVDVSLHKNHLSSGERIVRVDKEGKASLTVFRSLQTFKEATLLEATLHTGRTHQIRVHAQYRGHPVAGDDKYGDKEFNKSMRQYGLKRMFLHARSIAFTLPSTGQLIQVEAPLDADLEGCLSSII